MATKTNSRCYELDIEGRTLTYTLHRVVGRKHVHLVIAEDARLQVRAPWRFSRASAEEMIRNNLPWVADTMERAERCREDRVPLISGAELPLLDERLRVELRPAAQLDLHPGVLGHSPTRKVSGALSTPEGWIVRRGKVLKVVPQRLARSAPRKLVEAWYRHEAKRRLPTRMAHYAQLLGLKPRRVSIRGQRTRWGSCSSLGTICLNWRLLLLPSELSDYILIHELCHLRHLDHSNRFWALVASVMPDYSIRERRLEAMQTGLAL